MSTRLSRPTDPDAVPVGTRQPVVIALAVLGLVAMLGGVALTSNAVKVGHRPGGNARVMAEAPVTATDHVRNPANNSPMLLADPRDARFVAMANRLDAPDFGCALQVSGDGGRSWVTADPVPALPDGADKCYAPEVAFDADGMLYYLFVGLQGKGNEPMGAFLTTSGDRGATFAAPKRVLGPLNFGVRMAIDRSVGSAGRIHLVWLHANSDPPLGGFPAGPNPIMASFSDNGGDSFSEPVQVSDPDRARVVAPVLALDRDQGIHVGYYDLGDDARDYQGLDGPVWEGTWSVVVASSGDGGQRFGTGVVIDDAISPPERPMLIFTMAPPALVADGDRLCAAWTDARHGDADVMSRCSSEGGRRWGALRRLNDDAVGNGVRQYLPRLALAPGGRLDAVFFDRRHRPANAHNDVSYTYSTNGGRSFSANTRVTPESSSARVGPQYAGPAAEGQFEIGARLGLLSSRSGALAAWPDTRNSGDTGTAQDIFVAEVASSKTGQAGWARAVGGVLAAGGAWALVIAGLRARRRRHGLEPSASAGAAEAGEAPETAHAPGPRITRHVRGAVGLLVAVVLGAVAFTRVGATPDPRDLPQGPQMVDVNMVEYRFDYVAPANAGRTVFRVGNSGRETHRIGLFPLSEDFPPIDQQLRGEERRNIGIFVNMPGREPGQTQSFAVDLVAGQRYAMLCFVRNPDKKAHAVLGMNSEFRAGSPRQGGGG